MEFSTRISDASKTQLINKLDKNLQEGEKIILAIPIKIRFSQHFLILTNHRALKIDSKFEGNIEQVFKMSEVKTAKTTLGAGVVEIYDNKNAFAFSADKSDLQNSILCINKYLKPQENSPTIKIYSGEQTKKSKVNTSKEKLREMLNGEFPNVSPERLFNASLAAGAILKYSIFAIDRASYSVTFQTYASEKYWDGKVSCTIIPKENGSRLLVSGRAEQSATKSGWVSLNPLSGLTQLASEGSAHTAIARLKLEITRQIPNASENTKSISQETELGLTSQLRELKEMLDAGVLTQDEFDKAKSKLLG